MSATPGTVGAIFEKPAGHVRLDPDGRWWFNRDELGLDGDGNITIVVGDGKKTARITGDPRTLRRLADAINAQVEGAEFNTTTAHRPPPVDYVTSLGYTKTIAGSVQCDACGIAYEHADGAIMRGHRRRCPVAPADPATPGVCDS